MKQKAILIFAFLLRINSNVLCFGPGSEDHFIFCFFIFYFLLRININALRRGPRTMDRGLPR